MREKNAKLIRKFVTVAKLSDYAIFRMSEDDIIFRPYKGLKKQFRNSERKVRENMLKYMKSIAY